MVGTIPLQDNEWYVNNLAETLNMPRNTLVSWAKHGWVHISRKLPGYHGRIILWADATELARLRELRRTKHSSGDPPLPKALTTPKIPSGC